MTSYISLADNLGVEMITIYVGPTRQQFVVHKNLLMSRSNYFKGALGTQIFREAQEGIFTFEEDDPDAFRLLIAWLYQGGRIPRVPQYLPRPDFSKYQSRFSTSSPAVVPLSTQGEPPKYLDYMGIDPYDQSKRVIHHHLGALSRFEGFSTDEIRLADYENAQKNVHDPLRRDAGPAMEKPAILCGSDEDRLRRRLIPTTRRNWFNRETSSTPSVAQPAGPFGSTNVSPHQTIFTFSIDNPKKNSSRDNSSQTHASTGNSSQGVANPTAADWANRMASQGSASSGEEDHFEDAVETLFPRQRGSVDRSTTSWINLSDDNDSFTLLADYAGFMKDAEEHQMTLLKLVVLAERLCWDSLFNAAMDAFLDGEQHVMNRNHVPLEYIKMAYSECHDNSPVRKLFADMVHFEVKTCLTHSRYTELAADYMDFLTDLFKRLDHKSWIPGKGHYSAMSNPLRARRCVYHTHEAWTGCCPW